METISVPKRNKLSYVTISLTLFRREGKETLSLCRGLTAYRFMAASWYMLHYSAWFVKCGERIDKRALQG